MSNNDIIYEDAESYEDPYEYEDKDESMPELQQEKASKKFIHESSRMSKQKMQVHIETARERYEATIFKNDTLRKKYDIRRQSKK